MRTTISLLLLLGLAVQMSADRRAMLLSKKPVSSAASFDSDAQDYFDRVDAVGGTLTDDEKTAVNNFVVSAKADSYWTNIIECNPFGSDTWAGALQKLKYTSAIAAQSNTPVTFTAADFAKATGIKGGAGKYLQTGVNQDEMTIRGGLSLYVNDDIQSPGTTAFFGGDYGTFFAGFNGAHQMGYGVMAQPPDYRSLGPSLLHVWQANAASNTVMHNGVFLHKEAGSSGPYSAADLNVFARNGGDLNSTQRLAWYAIDGGAWETVDQASKFATNALTLIRALHRTNSVLDHPMNAVIAYGQSRSIGTSSGTVVSSGPQTNQNKTATFGPVGAGGNFALATLTPLKEISVETIGVGLADTYSRNSKLAGYGETNSVFFIALGVGGQAYSALDPSTANYQNVTNRVAQARRLSVDFNTSFRVTEMQWVHGETVDQVGEDYQAELEEIQAQFESDVQALTGQSEKVPMFTFQPASWTDDSFSGYPTNISVVYMEEAWKANPANIVIVSASYMTPYVDGVHNTAAGYRWMGEQAAKARWRYFTQTNFAGACLTATNIVRTNADVYATFNTVSNLVWDTSQVAQAANNGFEYYDDTATATISAVAWHPPASGPTNTVKITLSGTPTGANKRLRYAYTGTNLVGAPVRGADSVHGPRGNLRNNDISFVSNVATNLYDWARVFDEVVP